MNTETTTEPLKKDVSTTPTIQRAKTKPLDPKLLWFPIGKAANTQDDLDDMWDNLPV